MYEDQFHIAITSRFGGTDLLETFVPESKLAEQMEDVKKLYPHHIICSINTTETDDPVKMIRKQLRVDKLIY